MCPVGGPKAVQKAKRTAEGILQRLVFESSKGFCLSFFFPPRDDENRAVTHNGNITNLIRILEDFSFPVGMAFQNLSSLCRKPIFNL